MTTIGPSLTITGEVSSQEDITIHGRIKGQIRMNGGALVVAPTAKLQADVQGIQVTIHGSLGGDVTATRIELMPTADVNGTLTTKAVVIQDGAMFHGVLDMDKSKTKSPAKPAA